MYKNLLDWLSRIERNIFSDKPTLLLSTSPGANGGATALKHAVTSAPFLGAKLVGNMALANFYDNFDLNQGQLIEPQYQAELKNLVLQLQQALSQNTQALAQAV